MATHATKAPSLWLPGFCPTEEASFPDLFDEPASPVLAAAPPPANMLEGDQIRACRYRSEHRGPAILPAMQPAHEILARGRSPFAAAFLSLLFPGLGHAYLGAYRRALGFAAPLVLVIALAAGFAVRMNAFDLAGLAIQEWLLIGLFVGPVIVALVLALLEFAREKQA